MIKNLLVLNKNLVVIKLIEDVEDGTDHIFEVVYRYFEYFVKGDPVFGVWLKLLSKNGINPDCSKFKNVLTAELCSIDKVITVVNESKSVQKGEYLAGI